MPLMVYCYQIFMVRERESSGDLCSFGKKKKFKYASCNRPLPLANVFLSVSTAQSISYSVPSMTLTYTTFLKRIADHSSRTNMHTWA